jgi:CBS domain-containing protein
MKALLADVRAAERMVAEGRFETGIRRVGAEQEMFLVDDTMEPSTKSQEILADVNREELVHELALFNLEANASPQVFGGDCLSSMEAEITELVELADEAARKQHSRVLLTGILPTLELSDLGKDNMTPKPRYREIDRVTTEASGGAFRVVIKGRDELDVTHDNVMLESCNTSFQVHFQVEPAEFAQLYNTAQVVTAPVLAAAVNSPVLLQRQLWQETRVALFQHSVDLRSRAERHRNQQPRVSFGDRWVESLPTEVWRENIARHRVLFVDEPDEDPMKVLDEGGIPELTALRLHNGTVYRWNRVCYGHDGKVPHLRIEARALPAGPTILDEMANAAFYFGLMAEFVEEFPDVRERMVFDDARANFFAAARYGLKAQFNWIDGRVVTARDLILGHLLPMAEKGLKRNGIDEADITRYLGVIRERVTTERTGARWCRQSLDAMGADVPVDVRHRALTRAMLDRQAAGEPIHAWSLAGRAELQAVDACSGSYRFVGQFMTRDVFTVRPGDLVDLAASVMDWEHLRHVPVEDTDGDLVGLLSHRSLLRYVAGGGMERGEPMAVEDLMKRDPVTCNPDTTTLDAIELMRAHRVGCLPVMKDGTLVGIITETDLIAVAARLLDQHLRDD